MTTLRPFAAGMFAPMRNTDRLVAMKQSLDDLQRQLGTGKVSQTLGGLGAARGPSLSLRAELAETSAFRSVAQRADIRAGLLSASLERIGGIASEARRDAVSTLSSGAAIPPAAAQRTAATRLDAVIAALNENFDGQYLFAGAAATRKPVIAAAEMLGGTADAAGLNQLIEERRAADRGDGLGRLTLAAAGSSMRVAEEAPGLPFGLKLTSVNNGLSQTNATVGGVPAALDIQFAGQPQQGETISILFNLPDGSRETLALTARTSAGGAGGFAIGTTPQQTAANFAAALETGIRDIASTSLAAASAMVAAGDFFAATPDAPPQRVAGPPFATATGFAAAGSRPTISWYRGEEGDGDPRETQNVQVDRGLHLALGARASEAPFRSILAGLAALAAGPAPSAAGQRALAERAAGAVNAMNGEAGRAITADIGAARMQMAGAVSRHDQRDAILQSALGEAENVSIEQLSVEIVSLQTRLQASYQVTATVGRLNLADYLR